MGAVTVTSRVPTKSTEPMSGAMAIEVAFSTCPTSVEMPPAGTVNGAAVKRIMRGGPPPPAVTVIVTLQVSEPNGLVATIGDVVGDVGPPTTSPLGGTLGKPGVIDTVSAFSVW